MADEIPSGSTPGALRGGSGYKDGVYYSKRQPVSIPNGPYLDFTSFTFRSGKYLDRVALVDAPTGKSLSYRDLRQQVKSVASGLADLGVKKGDVVMILSPNSIQYPVLLLAITSIGAVVTAVNPLNTTKEVVVQAQDSKTKYLAAVPGLTAAAAVLKIPLILMDSDIQEYPSYLKTEVAPIAYFTDLLQADPRLAPKVRIRQTDTALVLYSSGTTGTSKGVVISHGSVIAAVCLSNDPSCKEDVQRTYVVTIPIYHLYGMVLLVGTQLTMGSKLVVLPRFELPKFLEAIERYKVTHAQTVTPIFNALVRSPLVEKYDLRSLGHITVGAAPVPKATLVACSQRYKNAFLRQGYALTESIGIATGSVPTDPSPRLGSAGITWRQ
ncbi:unnamed protein product [Calypogeia fissa]